MKTVKRFILILLLTMTSRNSFAEQSVINLTERLVTRNEITFLNQKYWKYFFDVKTLSRLDDWINHPQNNDYSVECQFKLRPYIKSPKLLAPLCYFLRQDDKIKRKNAVTLINYYIKNLKLALIEIAADPRYNQGQKLKAKNYLATMASHTDQSIEDCLRPGLNVEWSKAFNNGRLIYSPFQLISSCFQQLPKIKAQILIDNLLREVNVPYFAFNLALEFINHPGHVVSHTSWIPGNHVEYLNTNDYSSDLLERLKSKNSLIKELYPLNGAGAVAAMYAKRHQEVFTEEEGFFSIENNPIWNQKEGIFKEISESIVKAEKTIFIDIFFLGGTMGAGLAKLLIKQLEKKPELKVLILHDNVNHLTFDREMRPVFHFLQSYSHKHPDRMVVSASYIEGHRSGLPNFISPALEGPYLRYANINDPSGLFSVLPIYLGVKSDHSKVMAIDSKGPAPVAFVGSKNWTDSSGALCYDDVGKITGPAAAVVLDDYYLDMFYALKYETTDRIVEHWAKYGWSKDKYQPGQTKEQMIAHILWPFDLLQRNEQGDPNPKAVVSVPYAGQSLVRLGMNNVDSSVASPVDQDIQAILFAQKSIYINDQFVFDRNIVQALLIAKRKNPHLDIKLILHPANDAPIPGMPNLLYADVLTNAGIEVKFKIIQEDPIIRQEFHSKTISIDSNQVIVGSANKDFTTMYGPLREEQLEIFSESAAKTHDDLFLERWNSEQETTEVFTHFEFTLPEDLKSLDGTPLSPERFISFLRATVSLLYDSIVR